MKALEREVRELKQTDAILRETFAYFVQAKLSRQLNDDAFHRRPPTPLTE